MSRLLPFAVAALLSVAVALYEDQAGVMDWTRENVGAAQLASLRAKGRAVLATDAGVVAALNVKTGAVTWRRVFGAERDVVALEVSSSSVVSATTSSASAELQVWTLSGGELAGVAPLPLTGGPLFLRPLAGTASDAADWKTIAAVTSADVSVFDVSDAPKKLWSFSASSVADVVSGQWAGAESVFVCGPVTSTAATVTVLGAADGRTARSVDIEWAGGVAVDSVTFAALPSNGVVAVALSADGSSVVVTRVEQGVTTTVVTLASLGAASATGVSASQLLTSVDQRGVSVVPISITLSSGATLAIGVRISGSGAGAAVAVEADGSVSSSGSDASAVTRLALTSEGVLFATATPTGGVVVSCASTYAASSSVRVTTLFGDVHPSDAALTLPTCAARTSAGVRRVFSSAYSSKESAQTRLRVMVSMGDDALVYVNQGKLVWERDEYLASVDAVLSVDGSSLLREVKEEGDVDLSFASRLRHQLEEIQASFSDTLQTLSHAPQAFVDWLEDRRAPAQARADINPAYGFDRTVVVMKLLGDARTIVVAGVNTLSTAVVWEVVVVLGEPVPASATAPQRPSLLMSRARSFGAHAPEVVLSLPSIGAAVRINGAAACASSGSCAVWINAASGAVVDKAGWAHAAKQVTSLAGVHDSTHRQVFVAVSDGGDVRVLPSTSSALAAFERVRRSVVLHSAGSDTSRLSGFEVTAGADAAVFHTRPLWHMELAPEQHIRTVVHVDTTEPVTSAAVILGDDSLLTKYLNPHLIGVLSSSSGNYGDTDSTVEMRLVDTVSGRVLQSASHAHASPPLQAVRQENWFVYTFWNTKHKRTEIVSYAMFESSISRFELNPFKPPRQRPEFSSFDTIVPVMLSRSFVLPASVSALGVTRTRYGITTPHMLFGLTSGSVLYMNRMLLDPRRPIGEATDAEKSERLIQYSPVLPLMHRNVMTYNVSLPSIRVFHAAATHLESTTLVVAAGLDVFFSPLAPANAFDVLSSSLNKPLLVCVTVGFAVVAVVASHFVRRKRLMTMWR